MKNYFIYIIGIIVLAVTVWFTTMAGIKANKNDQQESQIYIIHTKNDQF